MTNSVSSTFGNFSDKELEKLKGAVRQMSDVMTMMEAQRETMKTIIDDVYDELKIPKKIIRKIAKTYHKQNFSEQVTENEEFALFYEGISSNS